MKKWWTYQKERFPLAQYVPMVIAFAFAGLSYSRRIGDIMFDNWDCPVDVLCVDPRAALQPFHYLVAMIVTLIWFMLLRIADEYKDYEEDKKYRPYRAVPRGLITLKELGYLAIILIVIQIGLTLWVNTAILFPLFIVYIWFFLMSIEFGVAKWLKKQHTLYLLSHMVMMLLINFYVTSIEWSSYAFYLILIPYLLAGYAAGLGKEVIHICNNDKFKEEGHFDIKQKSTVLWETVDDIQDALFRRIEATIGKNN